MAHIQLLQVQKIGFTQLYTMLHCLKSIQRISEYIQRRSEYNQRFKAVYSAYSQHIVVPTQGFFI